MAFDLVNGFHDAANSIATVVSTKVLSPTQAVIWAAIFNFAAYWVFDMSVGNTVAKTVDNSVIDLWVILAGLLAATTWNLLTWWLGIPSSSSHTLIGGFAGAAVAHAGFDVLKMEEITKPLIFIILAPIIGGVISFIITLMTIQRKFFIKLLSYVILTVFTVYMTWLYKDIFDIKPIMIWIIGILLSSFVIIFIVFELVVGKNNTAMKEGNLYKRLQLLSSAAFSLGHGGADSQKVMGIICAACIVYANGVRRGDIKGDIPEMLKVTEVLQVKYTNDEGKIKKFKPAVKVFENDTIYVDGKKIIDLTTKENLYEDEKIVANVNPNNPFLVHLKKENIDLNNFEKASKELTTLHVYTDKKDVHDTETKELIFKDKELNPNYRYAKIFAKYVDEKGKLKEDIKAKVETKVTNKTMPIWIAFGCYVMIGLGTLMGGWKIVKTMGTKITKVTPLEGVCSETAGALTLFTVSQMGVPVSTTHTITGSIIGVGATKRLSAVRWGVTINLIWAWILTIPVSALIAAIIYYILSIFN